MARIKKNSDNKTTQKLLALRVKASARIKRANKKKGIDYTDMITVEKPNYFRGLSMKEKRAEIKKFEKVLDKRNKDFIFRKNEHGVDIPLSLLDRIMKAEQQLKIKKRLLDDKNKQTPYMQGGKDTGMSVYQFALMSKGQQSSATSIHKYDVNKARDLRDIKRAVEAREKRLNPKWVEQQQVNLRENFITALSERFNSDADEVIALIKQVPFDDWEELYNMFDEIDFLYIPSNSELPGEDVDYTEKLKTILTEYHSGNIDTSLKFLNR